MEELSQIPKAINYDTYGMARGFRAELEKSLKRTTLTMEPVKVTAAQIHAELYAEVDELLVEPEGFAESEPVPSARVKTLRDMGFTEQAEVSSFEQERIAYVDRKMSSGFKQEQFEQAMAIAFRYPAYKFISTDALSRVMRKYGLERHGVSHFIGQIPDRNVAEMARFHEQVHIQEEDQTVLPGEYSIAAPPDQFKPEDRGIGLIARAFGVGGLVGSMPLQWLIDDPIVLKPIKSGYLIVTCWGDEASDPNVQNERHN